MLEAFLARGAKQMGIALDDGQIAKIGRYHEMLMSANRVMNLTRVPDDAQQAAERNYLDSLSPLSLPGLTGSVQTLLDVGSGAGCPGLVLSIALPHARVTLLDALAKRVQFLTSVIDALELNAIALHGRSEDAAKRADMRQSFDCVTARAVADLPTLLELGLPFVRVGGLMIAYKGPAAEEEIDRAQNALAELGGQVRGVFPVHIPGRDWDHRLVVIDKVAPTPAKYPRKAGQPGRKPL